MRRTLILPAQRPGRTRPLPAVACAVLLASCGASAPELDGTWESERDANAQVRIDGSKVTMTMAGLKPTAYEQEVERSGAGYVLRWTKGDGEVLRVEARLDGDRLLLAFEGQEFALRKAAAR